jgi:ketosteroid isomerase-like protein
MSEVEDFLSQVLPRYVRALDELHNGDPTALGMLWSRRDPVSVLGAAGPPVINGWENVTDAERSVASRFSNGTPVNIELIAADVNGDFAYTVSYESSSMSVAGGPVQPSHLRATQIYRRENGDWKLVHRHADPAGSPATDALRDALGGRPSPTPP